jgi:uncharacterized membrane protein
LGQKGQLFHLKLSIAMPSLENFEQKKITCLHFQLGAFELIGKSFVYLKKNRPAPAHRYSAAQRCFSPRPTRSFPSIAPVRARAPMSTRRRARASDRGGAVPTASGRPDRSHTEATARRYRKADHRHCAPGCRPYPLG